MASDSTPPFDLSTFPPYDTYLTWVSDLAAAYPDLIRLSVIGQSHRGRDLHVLTLTNRRTGDDLGKPGYYVDAVTHAEEVVGTNVALYLAWQLAEGYGKEPLATRLLDRMAMYILPRLNPDGADICIQTDHEWVGNGRFLPGEEQPGPGFCFHDVNGDGWVAQMRVPDPLGEWTVSDLDPRLMRLRGPDEEGGTYFRLLPEGLIRSYDGANVAMVRPRDGNINRNYPGNWYPEAIQYGAGDYPLSEPETRAVVEFLADHPNIGGVMSYHTHGGVILRPFSGKGDEHFHPEDLQMYRRIGAIGTEETGYPLISVYNDFTPVKSAPRGGTLTDWTFELLGLFSFVTELWDVYREAGVTDRPHFPLGERPETDGLMLLHWNDRVLGGDGFLPWRPVQHPQLGPVEIGGWKRIRVFRNPPGFRVGEIARQNARFVMRHAACMPRIELKDLKSTPLGGGLVRLEAVVENSGYLPTYVTHQALAQRATAPLVAELQLTEADLVEGSASSEIGHLSGRSDRRSPWNPFTNPWGTPRKAVSWVVRATGPGTAARLTVRGGRAGRAEASWALGGDTQPA